MLGALIGDMIGSIYEFNNKRSKDIELFNEKYELTDDSIMTLAAYECLINGNVNDLQKKAIDYVSAKKQAVFLKEMIDNAFLLDEEIDNNVNVEYLTK